ncbi:MAG TPA: hypothetical protein DIT04_13355 [Dysgonomonas sp.]|nr:hypothetical protein [Dysgonomonas sp.]
MIQEILVAITGIIVLVVVAHRVYNFFRNDKPSGGSCGCSHCGPQVSKNR